jgi:SAM-dependent methyltransferase
MKRDPLPHTQAHVPPHAQPGVQPAPLPPRDAGTDAAWRRIHDAACAPYRGTSRWAYHWARGKLGRDPAFRMLLERGDFAPVARIVDIGCGQGLVAALMHACQQQAPAWPAAWPAAPSARAYTGIELMQRDADRGRDALAGLPFAPQFICGDMRTTPLPACDIVVILDVLHYVDHAAQHGVLERVRDALVAGRDDAATRPGRGPGTEAGAGPGAGAGAGRGRLLLRVGDAAAARGFAASQWVDRIVTAVRGHTAPPTWGRTLGEWTALLEALGFVVQPVPMSQGTPFANVLLRADLR